MFWFSVEFHVMLVGFEMMIKDIDDNIKVSFVLSYIIFTVSLLVC